MRSLPVVFGLFSFWYDKYHETVSAVFTARAYEYGWGTGADHEKALEIIRDAAKRIREDAFVTYAPIIKKTYLEITGEELHEYSIPAEESCGAAENSGSENGCGSGGQSGCGPKSEADTAGSGADTVDGYIGEFENNAPYGSGMVIKTVGDSPRGADQLRFSR